MSDCTENSLNCINAIINFVCLLVFCAGCLGLFCPCILLCDVSSRMGEGCMFATCCAGALVGLRVKMRIQQNIQVQYSVG